MLKYPHVLAAMLALLVCGSINVYAAHGEDGVPQIAKYTTQAVAGDVGAQFKVGVEYLVGNDSLDKDNSKAYFWLTVAIDNGIKGDARMMAAKALKDLEQKATKIELEEGRRLLKEFRSTGDWNVVIE